MNYELLVVELSIGLTFILRSLTRLIRTLMVTLIKTNPVNLYKVYQGMRLNIVREPDRWKQV